MLLLHRKACQRPEVQAAVDAIKEAGEDLLVRITWEAADLKTFIEDGINSGVTRFIAGGGDGTVNGVANILMALKETGRPEMAVLPLGTANDFARGAGIPLDDLSAALKLAATGESVAIDMGVINDSYFVNVASGGFGAEITAETPDELKGALGGIAYTLVGLAKLWQLEPYRCKVTLDNSGAREVDVVAIAVGNNRYAGGGYEVASQASLTDGLLDFAAIKPVPMTAVGAVRAELEDPSHQDNEYLRYTQAENCVLESDRPLQLNLDGEPIVAERFEFSICPKAIRFVLPS